MTVLEWAGCRQGERERERRRGGRAINERGGGGN